MLTWPSRDLALVPTFLAHGLAPRSVLAVRLAGQGMRPGAAHVAVRRTTAADLDTIVAMELVRLNQVLGQMTERPNTAELIRAKHTRDHRSWSWSWSWLAEVSGTPIALLTVLDSDHAPWVSGLSSAGAAAYLSDLVVLADRRSAGVGAALVQHVHRELDGIGLKTTVLRYLGMNPLSGPSGTGAATVR